MTELKLLPLFLLAILVSLSCSLDYDEIEFAEKLGDNIPDNVIENFSYTSINDGKIVFRLYAQKAETYSQKNETILQNVVFREYNSDKGIATEGKAEKGIIHTDSDDAELSGSLIIYSSENEAEISAEYLYWNDLEKSLSGTDNGKVKLIKESGTQISGTGFKADMKTKRIDFKYNVEGIYHYEED